MDIAVLLSGGVDSSVALRMLRGEGHNVTAFYLKIWLEDELSFLGECPWEEDLFYVRKICKELSVPLEITSMQRGYWDRVVAYTIKEVKLGRTPNPDILCNQQIKFGLYFDEIGNTFDKVATGHYARVKKGDDGLFHLHCAPDKVKDQTYFLSYLSQKQLSHAMFPIGEFTKEQVRGIAQRFNLPNKDRKDSQGICFLGKIKFNEFLHYHLGDKKGDLVEFETRKKMGEHNGFWYYTIGQRQGIGLSHGPWYVVAKDPQKNIIYISKNYYSKDMIRNKFLLSSPNWILGMEPKKKDLEVKLRHGPKRHAVRLEKHVDGSLHAELKDRDQGIAPGQFAVFYDGDECLGGAVIELINPEI